jgi:hypothetical protein
VPLGSFCSGDGSLATPCPCGNVGAPGHGCANSISPNGVALAATGTTNPDTMTLSVSGVPGTSAIFLQGDTYDSAGIPFGDGLRCVDGNLLRLSSSPIVANASQFPGPGDPLLSVRGQVLPGSGAYRLYQVYYRNAAALFCPPETFNVSSGWALIW